MLHFDFDSIRLLLGTIGGAVVVYQFLSQQHWEHIMLPSPAPSQVILGERLRANFFVRSA